MAIKREMRRGKRKNSLEVVIDGKGGKRRLERLERIIREPCFKKFLVVGDIMLDEYKYLESDSFSPEFPVPLAKIIKVSHFLGGAGNVASNLIEFGVSRLKFITCIGGDSEGVVLRNILWPSYNDELFVCNSITTKKTRYIVNNEHVLRVDSDMLFIESPVRREMKRCLIEMPHPVDVILVSDYNKGVICEEVIEGINEKKEKDDCIVVLDPKPENKELYSNLDFDIMTPNMKESQELLGIDSDCGSELACKLQEKYDCHVVVTMSERGFCLKMRDRGAHVYSPALEDNAIDVTGAGDTFTVFMSLFYAEGFSLPDACNFANLASSIVVRNPGTSVVTKKDFEEVLHSSEK